MAERGVFVDHAAVQRWAILAAVFRPRPRASTRTCLRMT